MSISRLKIWAWRSNWAKGGVLQRSHQLNREPCVNQGRARRCNPAFFRKGSLFSISTPLFLRTGMGRPLKRWESQKTCLSYRLSDNSFHKAIRKNPSKSCWVVRRRGFWLITQWNYLSESLYGLYLRGRKIGLSRSKGKKGHPRIDLISVRGFFLPSVRSRKPVRCRRCPATVGGTKST